MSWAITHQNRLSRFRVILDTDTRTEGHGHDLRINIRPQTRFAREVRTFHSLRSLASRVITKVGPDRLVTLFKFSLFRQFSIVLDKLFFDSVQNYVEKTMVILNCACGYFLSHHTPAKWNFGPILVKVQFSDMLFPMLNSVKIAYKKFRLPWKFFRYN